MASFYFIFAGYKDYRLVIKPINFYHRYNQVPFTLLSIVIILSAFKGAISKNRIKKYTSYIILISLMTSAYKNYGNIEFSPPPKSWKKQVNRHGHKEISLYAINYRKKASYYYCHPRLCNKNRMHDLSEQLVINGKHWRQQRWEKNYYGISTKSTKPFTVTLPTIPTGPNNVLFVLIISHKNGVAKFTCTTTSGKKINRISRLKAQSGSEYYLRWNTPLDKNQPCTLRVKAGRGRQNIFIKAYYD